MQEKESASTLKSLYDTTSDCISALRSLNLKTNDWNDMLVYLVYSKLPFRTRELWDQQLGKNDDLPQFERQLDFLEERFRILEGLESSREQFNNKNEKKSLSVKKATLTSITKPGNAKVTKNASHKGNLCKVCNQPFHFLWQCCKFEEQNVEDRINTVKKLHLCLNCFSNKHFVSDCKSSYVCPSCGKNHHRMLHMAKQADVSISETERIIPSTSHGRCERPTNKTTLCTNSSSSIIFPTALIQVANDRGNHVQLRAVIDACSDASYITESAVKKLNLPRNSQIVQTTGLGDVVTATSQHITQFKINSLTESFETMVKAYILPRISSSRPPHYMNLDLPNLENFRLADPTFHEGNEIDLLLGGDIDSLISKSQMVKSSHDNIVFKESKLGWIVSGGIQGHECFRTASLINVADVYKKLDNSIRKFWECEETPNAPRLLTKDEISAESHYIQNTRRNENGKYVVALPFKGERKSFHNMRHIATKRLLCLKKKLAVNQDLKNQYTECLEEYEQMGHMTKIEDNLYDDGYFLPHHCVLKESSTTTRLRVVFDASTKDSNFTSLNENILNGPILQADLLDLVLRFRLFKFAFTADIEKMYRQIWISPSDYKYQLILWRKDSDMDLNTYVLKTVTFGTTSAPYLAIKTLFKLADDEESTYPLGAECLRHDFYVDDLISGADTLEKALEKQSQVINILQTAGFHLRKWSTNDNRLLQNIPSEDRELKSLLYFDDSSVIKTLGIHWNPKKDTFSYVVKVESDMCYTKRSVLSEISKIFDPLGWVSPCIVIAKLLIQSLWLKNVDWDTPITGELLNDWLQLKSQLTILSEIQIPRWVGISMSEAVEIHGFADASEKAYAAVIYIRVAKPDSIPEILLAKTKVAPLKRISLPRLELNAAVLLSRLMRHVEQALRLKYVNFYYWSDSMITLAWIRDHPHKRKTYVANRVSEIQFNSDLHNWFHVKSADNPADLGSRGVLPMAIIQNNLWWHGPSFLANFSPNKHKYFDINCILPDEDNRRILSGESEAVIKISSFLSYKNKSIVEATADLYSFEIHNILNKYSTLSKLCRIIAYCLRIKKCNRPQHIYVSCEEFEKALKVGLRIVQMEYFAEEIKLIRAKHIIHKKSSLYCLNPIYSDEDKLLRVSSRLGKATHIDFDQKYPIILPYNSKLSELIVRDAHNRTLHGTVQQTWMLINQRYHIIKCKHLVRKIIRQCVTCTRFRSLTQVQQMAQLPISRIMPGRPFNRIGVDLAGPFEIKKWKGKCNKFLKSYFAIFVCFCTKAVHLEVVVDLSSQEFIAAYKRFIARRGIPKYIHSDCGTNFIGAQSVITRQRHKYVKKWNEEMASYLSDFKTEWHFNPPSSPHFGGLWESGVKSAKYHLKRVIGNAHLSYDEFETVLLQVEACMNSRPLCKLDGDPNSEVLTPGHFLIQSALNALPQNEVNTDSRSYINRWKYLELLFQRFWKLWSSDYINTLRQRQKWRIGHPNLKEDDVVLIKEDNLPPNKWRLGRIVKLHTGTDGLVRVVSVKCGHKTYERPIVKLCVLPVHEDMDE